MAAAVLHFANTKIAQSSLRIFRSNFGYCARGRGLNRLPVQHRVTLRQKTAIDSHPTSWTELQIKALVFGLWENTRVNRKNTQVHLNMNSTQRDLLVCLLAFLFYIVQYETKSENTVFYTFWHCPGSIVVLVDYISTMLTKLIRSGNSFTIK